MLVLWEVYVKIDIAAKSLLLEAFPGRRIIIYNSTFLLSLRGEFLRQC